MTDPFALLRDRVAGFFLRNAPERLGVAVSGGSDSLGLLVLLADWAGHDGPDIHAVTVDHGLRAEAAAEAETVARICADMGVPHDIVRWQGWDGTGNLPDQARRARYALISDWAAGHGITQVAVGHTMDDQAETFLMRLGREAGVDGLAAMAPRWRQGEVEFCRPVLRVSRGELRSVLRARGIAWIDDPTNEDMAYDRTRARRALEALSGLGITPRVLSNVSQHMADVRETLYWYVFLAARDLVRFQSGDIVIERKGFRTLQREIARRLVQEALKWVGGAEYPPRGRALELLMESIRGGTGMTLHGCLITITADTIRVGREARAVEGLRCGAGACWDGRWRLQGPWPEGAEVAMLGEEGLAQCPDWRETGLPAAALRASPAVWRGEVLLAAPLAGCANGWRAELTRDEDHFFAALLSH